MLDLNGDGNPWDDILRMAGKTGADRAELVLDGKRDVRALRAGKILSERTNDPNA